MGINVNGLRFLLYAKSVGVDFTATAMIGRQGLHLSFKQFSHVLLNEYRADIDIETLEILYDQFYCDDLLRYLGARSVHSYDYSGYEDSTYVHDFNQPLPDDHFSRYSVVIEGGTLEHVFNFPIAIRNCMQMLAVGGHYLGISPTNNYMGHGFYQFSPELFYSVFSRENGFVVEQMLLHEGRITEKWFSVPDPDDVKQRVGLVNSVPMLLLILAAKQTECPIFTAPPIQSDYVTTWDKAESRDENSTPKNVQHGAKRWIPQRVKAQIRRTFSRSLKTDQFEPFDPLDF